MAILADKPKEALRHTVLAYGPSKAGKTESVGKLATLGYNLHWFDVEDGALTLSKLPEEAKRRINLYSIKDTAENSYAAKTLLKVLNWRNNGPKSLCIQHGLLDCPSCKKEEKPFDSFDITKLGLNDIIVIDSLTQLSDSILNSLLASPENKPEYDHWRNLGVKLDSVVDWMKAAPCHVIMITHEQDIEMEDGRNKLTAVGGTKNYARNLPRHFSHVVYFSVVNKSHTAQSKSVALNGVVTGSRTDADVTKDPTNPLGVIFPKLATA